jgi:hypothetical protein
MAKLVIKRSNQRENKIRKIRVCANGADIGEIEHDQVKEYELPPGNYEIEAKIDWCGSNTIGFTIKEGETKRLFLSGRPFPPFIPFVSAFKTIYYVTFGRKQFLILEEK